MNEIGFEDVQSAAQSVYLMLDFALYVRGLACFITYVNVHTRLGSGRRSHQKVRRPSLRQIVHPPLETHSRFAALHSKIVSAKRLDSSQETVAAVLPVDGAALAAPFRDG
jgi:hypothetical protein